MGDNIGTQFGQTLRTARQASGLTQEQAAVKAGIKLRQWCRYEAGENTPGSANLIAIANAIGVPPEWFFPAPIAEPVAE